MVDIPFAVMDILQYVIYYFLKAFCNNIFFRYFRKSKGKITIDNIDVKGSS